MRAAPTPRWPPNPPGAPNAFVAQPGATLFTRRDDVFEPQSRVGTFSSGQPGGLARALISAVALPMLFRHLPGLRLAGAVPFAGWAFRAPLNTPVEWAWFRIGSRRSDRVGGSAPKPPGPGSRTKKMMKAARPGGPDPVA
ncbi:MAG: hypothetical protein GY717_19525 [Rhodobacteraceae bacterium]|nr:hypothetical protein [Paracoccaceae bacterium]